MGHRERGKGAGERRGQIYSLRRILEYIQLCPIDVIHKIQVNNGFVLSTFIQHFHQILLFKYRQLAYQLQQLVVAYCSVYFVILSFYSMFACLNI